MEVASPSEPVATRSKKADAPVRPPSFDEVYDEYAETVWRGLRRLGVPDAALDDAMQDVFVVVYRRLGEFEGRSQLRTWLFGIALGIARNYRRSAKRRAPEGTQAAEVDDDLPAPDSKGPEGRAAQAEAVRTLYSLLDELDEDKRTVFVLADLEEMTAPEIAAALSLNLNTVYARIRAARLAFEQTVARHRAKEGT
ncbi:MAG: sigma-70 family RNA polymerase sigma factor [Polyangiaceae bacterium]|nr:sigma-70 family RNA polymerase sigma factor [Polyangiaceae bacterium]